jgi:hypothetical protein
MKLVLKFEQDCSVPVAWCELCNTEITDALIAMVYWRLEDYKKDLFAPLLAHKRCMSASPSRDERYDCSMELSTYLAFLLTNIRLTGAKYRQAFQNAGLSQILP